MTPAPTAAAAGAADELRELARRLRLHPMQPPAPRDPAEIASFLPALETAARLLEELCAADFPVHPMEGRALRAVASTLVADGTTSWPWQTADYLDKVAGLISPRPLAP